MSSISFHARRNIRHETLGKGEDLFFLGIAGCVCVAWSGLHGSEGRVLVFLPW